MSQCGKGFAMLKKVFRVYVTVIADSFVLWSRSRFSFIKFCGQKSFNSTLIISAALIIQIICDCMHDLPLICAQ